MSIILITLIIIVLKVFLVFIFLQSKSKTPKKISGIYKQPGKWYYLKYLAFLGILQLRKFKSKILENWKAERKTNTIIKELEKLQPLSSHEKAFDAVFFQATNTNGYYLCGGTERRHGAKTFGLFYIVVPDLGLLESEHLPNTLLQTDPLSIHLNNTFAAEGIQFAPVKPMQLWKISFNGKMKLQNDPTRTFDVKLEANWISDYPYFLYERDMNSKALARAVAREEWSEEYFKAMKEAHQTHYEQMGYLKGTLLVNNKRHELNMSAFRDHSFGFKRDWSKLHRYIFHMLYLSNGTKIVIGVISNPSTISHFEVGYVVHKDKSIDSIETCDLNLYQHGEKGMPGKSIAFSVVAGKKIYTIKIKVEYEAEHYKGYDNEARLIERFFKCNVNGVEGRGIAEWHYNTKT